MNISSWEPILSFWVYSEVGRLVSLCLFIDFFFFWGITTFWYNSKSIMHSHQYCMQFQISPLPQQCMLFSVCLCFFFWQSRSQQMWNPYLLVTSSTWISLRMRNAQWNYAVCCIACIEQNNVRDERHTTANSRILISKNHRASSRWVGGRHSSIKNRYSYLNITYSYLPTLAEMALPILTLHMSKSKQKK